MYKVTYCGKTMVGCNEDNWRLTSRIWFENANENYKYGVAFTGSRWDGANGFAPQSGMNNQGLVYSRLASPTPITGIKQFPNKKTITNPTQYLKDILHNCKNITDVKNYISNYNQSYFLQDVFIYVEKSGKYLIVEPYAFVEGEDAKYVLANFCPSATNTTYANKLERYKNGSTFLKNKLDSTLAFCTALSDTMHVCRNKIGDGTLLTSIWDANNGTVNLFFYHNYKNAVQFNIATELAKGNHILEIPKLFPTNAEFNKLAAYKIPQNNMPIAACLLGFAALFFMAILYFLISAFSKKGNTTFSKYKFLQVALCALLIYYIYILLTEINIFYFPSPYKNYKFGILDIMAFTPFVLVICIVPLLLINFKIIKNSNWHFIAKSFFTLNNMAYIGLLGLFMYWRLLGF